MHTKKQTTIKLFKNTFESDESRIIIIRPIRRHVVSRLGVHE